MCRRLINYHKDKSEMTVVEVSAGVGIIAAFLSGFGWLKHQLDISKQANAEAVGTMREEHAILAQTLAKDYMDKDSTIQMYSMMHKGTEVRMTGVESAINELKESNSDNFKRLYEKLDKLAER